MLETGGIEMERFETVLHRSAMKFPQRKRFYNVPREGQNVSTEEFSILSERSR